MIDKLRKIKVKTPKGERELLFTKYNLPTTEGRIPCTDKCPYAEICDYVPHPEDPENPDVSFIDFCGGVGLEDPEHEDLDLIPKDGSIEKAMADLMKPDVYQKILENKRLVSIDTVVDNFCSGWCDYYTPDHSNCRMDNMSCLMRDVFIKSGKEPKKEDKSHTEENKSE